MAVYVLERVQVVPVPRARAFAFFADPTNLQALTPPWLRFRIVQAPDELTAGSILRYRLRLYGVPIRWRTEIVEWHPPRSFVDVQRRGPFRSWEHTHRLTPVASGTEVYDQVRYRLFGGPAGRLVDELFVRRWLRAIFDYRAAALAELVTATPVEPPLRTASA